MMQSELPQRIQSRQQQTQFIYTGTTGWLMQSAQVSRDFEDGSPLEVFLLICGLSRPLRQLLNNVDLD